MSKLIVNNSNSNLKAITLDKAEYIFHGIGINNINDLKITHNNISHSTIFSDSNGNSVEIETNNNNTIIHSNNIVFARFENNTNFDTTITFNPEITVKTNDNVTDLVINNLYNDHPVTFNNYSLSLQTISVNSHTIFNNFGFIGDQKPISISISQNNTFEQTNDPVENYNDLPISELNLGLNTQIKFTHGKYIYKLANPLAKNSSEITISDLHKFVEVACSLEENNYKNLESSEYNIHYLASFILQNQNPQEIPLIGADDTADGI